MKRDLIVTAMAVILGLGSGTGVAMLRGGAPDGASSGDARDTSPGYVENEPPDEVAATDNAVPSRDAASDDGARATASSASANAPTTSAPATAAASSASPSAPSPTPASPPTGSTAAATPAAAAVAAAVDDSAASRTLRRLGRIFSTMGPREAARILVQLDDADVLTILRALTEKQAGAILANLPPERAAAMSRAALREHRSPPP